MCLYPRLLPNKKYKANKKNGGIIPAIPDKRVLLTPTACGNCMECRKAKARDWQVRMLEDIRTNKNGIMVALTFSNEAITKLYNELRTPQLQGYDLDNAVTTVAVERFRERWRKEFKKSPRHWLITELGHGKTEHIHLHGIIWTDEPREKIQQHWSMYGNVWMGDYVNERTINYNIKYVHKIDEKHKTYKPKIYTSSGIGSNYVNRKDAQRNKFAGKETKKYYVSRTGHKLAMPQYYANKIYNEQEREKLWLQKLDEQVRYINGRRIDISKNETEYKILLAQAQTKNKELGYGDNKIDWSLKNYEKQRRILKQLERAKPKEPTKKEYVAPPNITNNDVLAQVGRAINQ